ncbi:MAG: autotransporter strand-loop-strand O-heptosyltransferase [Candidatus Accumulibacter sp.]|nr:autotransporter strand-loop-strand O-heptosyltransferase [Accumulibacter sp.]
MTSASSSSPASSSPASAPVSSAPAFGEEPALSAATQNEGVPSPAGLAAGPAVVEDPFFIKPPDLPTQIGPLGVRFDFNDGARVWLPRGSWHVQIEDFESGNILFACDADEGWVVSSKKFFVLFAIKIWVRGDTAPIVDHVMNLRDRPVLIKFPVGTLGDLIGWFPYAEKFLAKHGCVLECALGRELVDIFSAQYPAMRLSVPQEVRTLAPYASFRIGLFFGGNKNDQPVDFRMVGLHRTAGHILGVDPAEEPPRLALDIPRRIVESYVCIATKSSCQAKFWNNGHGWNAVVAYLRALGYRVLAIDREATVGMSFTWNQIPHEAEDFTGHLALTERIALLRHADFFIGLSSGLSWLAWACRVPVVLISGFTLPVCEFNTPYRVFSPHGCNGCWDDITLNFDHRDFFWCPRQKGTERQYECSRLITGKQVIGHVERLLKDRGIVAPKERGERR